MALFRNTLGYVRGGLAKMFGYDVAEHDARRRQRPTILRSEDRELDASRRRKAVATARDIRRNFSLVSWAIRRHVDYVSKFSFQCKIGDLELDSRYAKRLDKETSRLLNKQIEELVWQWSQPGNFEPTGRFSLDQFMRLVESSRVIDGDIGILKLINGMVQPIESDRIRNTTGLDACFVDHRWIQGVRVDDVGKAVEYAVHKRTPGGSFVFERNIDADHMILHGYYERFDQVRGIAPVTSAVNTFCDIYEGLDYALIKAKFSQMFGIKFKTKPSDELIEEDKLSDEDKEERDRYRTKTLDGKSSFILDLDPDEDAEIMESQQPSDQFQNYQRLMIMVALKALDLPYAMFDETDGKFYGNRSGIVQYIESCRPKRADNVHLLNHLTRWRLAYEIMQGRLTLPAGMTVNDVYFVWTPNCLPWWDAERESKGLFSTVQYGFDSYTGVCQKRGIEFEEVLRQRKRDEDHARELGITLPTMVSPDKQTLNTTT